MSALFGWLDSPIGVKPPGGVLEAMRLAHVYGRTEPHRERADLARGLSAQGRHGEFDLAAEDSLWAAIVGQPRWTRPELAEVAHAKGHAAALKEAYRRYGEHLFAHLRGSFALAVIAAPEKRVLLAVDRLGIQTLCYSWPKSGGFVFGSRADMVRAHPAVTGTIAEQTIFDYLFFGVCPSPGTIYKEQSKLLPAQYLVYENGAARAGFYWQMPYRENNERNVADLSLELMDKLRGAVSRIAGNQDPSTLGAFLSGGLDSSTVAGLLSETTHRHAKTFTIGFSHDEYDEVHYAEIAARHFATEQHNYYLTPKDVVALLPELSRGFDEPFGNSSVMPAYYCAKMAKEHGVQVMLAGDGGDEIFAGNSRYVEQQILDFYGHVPEVLRRYVIEPVVLSIPGFDKLPIGGKAWRYIQRARMAMPARLESNNFYRTARLAEVLTPDVLAEIDPEGPIANLRDAYERTASRSMLHRMLHLDLKITLADNDLRKVSGACEMAGIAVAYPFLDDEVMEFSAQIPPELLIRRFERRWFFKQAVQNFLAAETLAKRKHGFGMPFTEWPREDAGLREITVDCLEGFKRRGYLRADFLDRMIRDDQDGHFDVLIWDILILELWFREQAEARGMRAA